MRGPLQGKVRAVDQQGLQLEGEEDEDEDVEDSSYKDPLCALVKNCNVLHNIAGPACIFLKQGFSQTLVCSRRSVHALSSHNLRATFSNSFSSPHRV